MQVLVGWNATAGDDPVTVLDGPETTSWTPPSTNFSSTEVATNE